MIDLGSFASPMQYQATITLQMGFSIPHAITKKATELPLFSSIEGSHTLCHPREVTYLPHSTDHSLMKGF
jgi:hypothetical protein